MPDELTFATLDDLLLARELGHTSSRGYLDGVEFRAVGPVLEILASDPEGPCAPKALAALGPSIGARAAPDSLTGHINLDGLEADAPEWVGFGLAAQKAAERAGFPKRVAQALVGAISELYDNVHEHSLAPETGVAAYRLDAKRFEFAVSDRGVGVLRSLQSEGEWSLLTTSGEALQVALSDGNSRFGAHSGRGYGYRGLFLGLASLGSHLRFRSGNASLEIRGVGPQLASACLYQRPHLPGLHVSVVCQQVR